MSLIQPVVFILLNKSLFRHSYENAANEKFSTFAPQIKIHFIFHMWFCDKTKRGIVQYGFLNLKDGEGGGWKEFYRKHYLGISINMIRLYSVYYRLSRCTFLPVWLTFDTPQWLSSCHSLMKNQVVKYGTVVICYTCVTGKFWPLWKQTVQTSKKVFTF